MKRLTLFVAFVFATAPGYAQVLLPDTTQRISSTTSPGVSYDFGAAGADGSFSILKVGAGQRLMIDGAGNVTIPQNLTVNGVFSATNFAGSALTGGATGLTLNAGGTNQSITLTPSGTGQVILATPLTFSGTSSFTSASGQPLTFGTGTSGSALTIASATNQVSIAASTASTSSTTGALIVAGGAGIGGNLNVGGSVSVTGSFSAPNYTASSGAITGGSSGLTLNAGGTNQSITLTPSGTGGSRIVQSGGFSVPSLGASASLGFGVTTETANYGMFFGTTAGGPGWIQQMRSDANPTAYALYLQPSGGNVLLGTTTDSSNGRLQLAAHTTSAGGIGFGTDTNLYRSAADTLKTDDALVVGATTVSTSSTTGALTVAGGTGIAGDLNVGSKIGIGLGAAVPGAPLDVGTDARIRRDLYVDGVIHVASGNVQAATTTDAIRITSTTESTGYGTGALIVSGGAGITKNLYVGGIVDAPYLKVSGQNVWHTGNFNPANYVQQSGGVVSGGLAVSGSFSGGSTGL